MTEPKNPPLTDYRLRATLKIQKAAEALIKSYGSDVRGVNFRTDCGESFQIPPGGAPTFKLHTHLCNTARICKTLELLPQMVSRVGKWAEGALASFRVLLDDPAEEKPSAGIAITGGCSQSNGRVCEKSLFVDVTVGGESDSLTMSEDEFARFVRSGADQLKWQSLEYKR